jgi:predicted flap endonuclease-1-like 5' DNA nuclease
MSYLIIQTFVLLLAAALLGALLAWYLTRMVAANDRAGLQARVRAAEREAAALQERLNEGERARESLVARLAETESALVASRAERAATPAQTAPPSAPEPRPAVAAVAEGTRPPAALAGEGYDDLQQIKGIGPRIAATLAELGIGRFEQIAAWTPDHVAWINAHLRFKGRVEREDWITQARNLAAQSAGD